MSSKVIHSIKDSMILALPHGYPELSMGEFPGSSDVQTEDKCL